MEAAKASGCPWIIGLDAQEEPADFLKWAAPVIERDNGTIAPSGQPTHFPGVGQARCLDNLIIDRAISQAVVKLDLVSELRCWSADADYTTAAKPHRVVRLVLKKKCAPPLLDVLRLPRAFPRHKPIGCARAPVLPRVREEEAVQGEAREVCASPHGMAT